eukprot:gnl/TRDRNA2_/TRDRNA2_161434_c0_seq1.p2 gnl/TRDRNA2_/TRDRNA2_161434_c0~~gnl/TRDRNA2_/TRDRNA2_161434_c0_seq1.p2  ORF type:complete len:102 (+),score=18.41 gnl/TRDRNA2_/TRDRNA2_161434_c0_seq1:38-343(+)
MPAAASPSADAGWAMWCSSPPKALSEPALSQHEARSCTSLVLFACEGTASSCYSSEGLIVGAASSCDSGEGLIVGSDGKLQRFTSDHVEPAQRNADSVRLG